MYEESKLCLTLSNKYYLLIGRVYFYYLPKTSYIRITSTCILVTKLLYSLRRVLSAVNDFFLPFFLHIVSQFVIFKMLKTLGWFHVQTIFVINHHCKREEAVSETIGQRSLIQLHGLLFFSIYTCL